jgi:fluoride exporter
VSVWLYVAVAVLGAAGALLRFGLDLAVQRALSGRFPIGRFPFGTLLVNVSGCLVLGFLVGRSVTGDAEILAGTAFLGSFTTFSTWLLETERLAEDGLAPWALVNLLGGLAAGLVATAAGWALGAAM